MPQTVVAFFSKGSVTQLVLSILVSGLALSAFCLATPYKLRWMNALQGSALGLVWITLQAGLMVKYKNTGGESAFMTLVGAANIMLLASPILLGILVGFKMMPMSMRERLNKLCPAAEKMLDDDDDAPVVLNEADAAEKELAEMKAARIKADDEDDDDEIPPPPPLTPRPTGADPVTPLDTVDASSVELSILPGINKDADKSQGAHHRRNATDWHANFVRNELTTVQLSSYADNGTCTYFFID